jgi:hypothetical protein
MPGPHRGRASLPQQHPRCRENSGTGQPNRGKRRRARARRTGRGLERNGPTCRGSRPNRGGHRQNGSARGPARGPPLTDRRGDQPRPRRLPSGARAGDMTGCLDLLARSSSTSSDAEPKSSERSRPVLAIGSRRVASASRSRNPRPPRRPPALTAHAHCAKQRGARHRLERRKRLTAQIVNESGARHAPVRVHVGQERLLPGDQRGGIVVDGAPAWR